MYKYIKGKIQQVGVVGSDTILPQLEESLCVLLVPDLTLKTNSCNINKI